MRTIQNIIQEHIVGEIFSEFPTNLDTNTFDFFIKAGVNCSEHVEDTPLATEWGYHVCQAYELHEVKEIRELMQSMYIDLEKLRATLFHEASHVIQINKDEIESESAFYEIAQYPNAILNRQGTNDEFVTFITVSEESLS